jgi:Pyruvate/2-oxoacid:ferredoxin oxidoreductase delta subunit
VTGVQTCALPISFTPEGKAGYVQIDPLLCNGCGVCAQLCATNSMAPAK